MSKSLTKIRRFLLKKLKLRKWMKKRNESNGRSMLFATHSESVYGKFVWESLLFHFIFYIPSVCGKWILQTIKECKTLICYSIWYLNYCVKALSVLNTMVIYVSVLDDSFLCKGTKIREKVRICPRLARAMKKNFKIVCYACNYP